MEITKLSKSDYILGLQCPLALWFKYHRKDLTPPVSEDQQALFDSGNEIGEYAKKYFGSGFEVTASYWELEKAINQTKKAVKEGEAVIFEATAQASDGTYSRIDILRKVPNADEWDLIEVKGSTSVKDYHLEDIAFQYYVFHKSGYKIRDCYLMVIDNQYIRSGEVEPEKLFKLENVSNKIMSKFSAIEKTATQFMYMLERKGPPPQRIGACCITPFECGYKSHCWKNIPEYSVFDVFDKNQSEKLYHRFGADLKKLPEDYYPKGKKSNDIICYLRNEELTDRDSIKEFLGTLEYPLYFLDYETFNSAIPLFDGTRPFQQVPFQFSLHIQREINGDLEHIEFLHKEKIDPREEFIKSLISSCGDKGSVVVYNQAFEARINKELANDFPQYEKDLLNITSRMVDLLVPFRNRSLYSPKQKGSASIKYTLPAFTDMSYSDMEIGNGGEAMNAYLGYQQDRISKEVEEDLLIALLKYCKQDTLAMVKLLEVLWRYSK